ncbi:putative metalloprotease CJM1_0395 family protein [Pseudomonas sp. RIT-PI-AD]|uniref:putative metalloprotease CJM1_0395 family protein n=1 Tax=Pseudomonas sp. RIT-PI-AD TaxID=3035294 RepID=UPI0021D83421|nr:putative metalloprotease CJM1_0395 family protein [Pseudomonas sp. RIT-PI-AD]
MQIGSAMIHVASLPYSLPARPVSPDSSADLARANPSPVPPVQPSSGPGFADSDASADSAKAQRDDAERVRLEQQQIAELANRDRDVRNHEQAHAAVGGAYAGAPSYTYERGPDGRTYAVGGEVSINVGASADDPETTLRKMISVQAAALAPADPSSQDLSVAARASAQAARARMELASQQSEAAGRTAGGDGVETYRRVSRVEDASSALDLSA